jgi:hypothetical protein
MGRPKKEFFIAWEEKVGDATIPPEKQGSFAKG